MPTAKTKTKAATKPATVQHASTGSEAETRRRVAAHRAHHPATAPKGKSPSKPDTKGDGQAANLGFEATLFKAADKLRNNMDAAEYKHVVLGLIFLKYISDAFQEKHDQLIAEQTKGADPEDRDEYKADNIFWVPKVARWSFIQGKAKQPEIGKLLDDAMDAIEKDNPTLKGVLPKNYARPAMDKQRLGELIDLIATIGLGRKENKSKDILGRVYEYFLSEFASAEGKKGGQFYTPRCVVQTLVTMLAPYKGRVYDPCCGSGGMFVQSEKFIEEHGGKLGDISVYGQESNSTTWRLAKMNLAIRGIDSNLGREWADTFRNDQHKDLKADYVLANPPFNDSDWGGEHLREDARWQYGTPPSGNANFAWVQHFIHHLSPTGQAGFVLANGSMSSQSSGEGEIRKAIVEADLVDCMVALPGQLFYSTQIPVCLWFLTRDKRGRRLDTARLSSGPKGCIETTAPLDDRGAITRDRPSTALGSRDRLRSPASGAKSSDRDRRNEVLFIDARKMGTMIDRAHRELTDADIEKIAGTYHAWRGDAQSRRHLDTIASQSLGDHSSRSLSDPKGRIEATAKYQDGPGFCKSATLDEIREHNYVLTPGRYVGAEDVEEDDEAFEDKMQRLTQQLYAQMAEGEKLDAVIKKNLKELGFHA